MVDALVARGAVKYAELVVGESHPIASACPRQQGGDPAKLPDSLVGVAQYQWDVRNVGQTIAGVTGAFGDDTNLARALQVTSGSASILIAVVDNAIDITHPSIAGSLWTNPGEVPGDGIDKDDDGVVDDVHGVMLSSPPTGDPTPDPLNNAEWWSHGTASAGIIAGDPTQGYRGIATGCRVLPIGLIRTADDFLYQSEKFVKALDFALARGARVSSWSIASSEIGAAFDDLLYEADHRNHVLICAAGNDNCDLESGQRLVFPALFARTHPSVIAVAGTDNKDCLALYNNANITCGSDNGSNFGASTVLVGAPGWWIPAIKKLQPIGDGAYYWFGGTSAAAPHVSGAVASPCRCIPNIRKLMSRMRFVNPGERRRH